MRAARFTEVFPLAERGLGVEAYGIDRHLDVAAPYLEQADWFAYEFGCERWAALISNMAFTNHLTYALTQDGSQLAAYLDRYAELLLEAGFAVTILRRTFFGMGVALVAEPMPAPDDRVG